MHEGASCTAHTQGDTCPAPLGKQQLTHLPPEATTSYWSTLADIPGGVSPGGFRQKQGCTHLQLSPLLAWPHGSQVLTKAAVSVQGGTQAQELVWGSKTG